MVFNVLLILYKLQQPLKYLDVAVHADVEWIQVLAYVLLEVVHVVEDHASLTFEISAHLPDVVRHVNYHKILLV